MADLFVNKRNEITFDDVIKSLNDILKKVEIEKELPEGCLYIRDNVSKSGKFTSRSICIHEPYYPAPYGDEVHDNWVYVVLTFSFKETSKGEKYCSFLIKQGVLKNVGVIGTPKISPDLDMGPNADPDKSITVRYLINDPLFLNFMKKRVNYAIKYYHSFDDLFSCCYRYVQCSDAKKCLHPNKLYSTACVYRHNLERGRIFYGKNKNFIPEQDKNI